MTTRRDAAVTALDLGLADPMSDRTKAYFDKCEEKLGLVPNVLLAYAFDEAKLEAFSRFYNEVMLADSEALQARPGDHRRRRLGDQSLSLLPRRPWGGPARTLRRPDYVRDDRPELARRRP
nr:hypothetical protein [Jiella pelagia]